MLSNQILHKTVQDIKQITGFECAVWNMRGTCLVMTNERMIGFEKEVAAFIAEAKMNRTRVKEDVSLFLVCDDGDPI